MVYVDGLVIPIPTKDIDTYRKMARKAGTVWTEHGALGFRECLGDDLEVKDMGGPMVSSSLAMTGAKERENVLFSYVVYRNKRHRDTVNKKVMKDERLVNMMAGKEMPFDTARMGYGGFKAIVDLG